MYLYAHCNDIKAVAQILGQNPETSMVYYVKARQAEELKTTIESAYSGETMIPNAMDDLIKAGLI